MTENVKINRGLKGIYFERSGGSHIDGSKGELLYRGYTIHDLAQRSTFEEVCYLLIHGDLPNAGQLAEFDAALKEARALPDAIFDIIRAIKGGLPMDVLRSCVSSLAALEPGSAEKGEEGFLKNGIRLTRQVPMIIAAHEAIRNGRDPVPADKTLSHAANWLWMLSGEKPSEAADRLADVDFILHAEHGANASSFAARVTAGTEANLHGAMVTALTTLAGPAHGRAAEDVMKMVTEIGNPDRAAEYVKAKRKNREAVTGFGHRVYRTEDPRAPYARRCEKLGEEKGAPEFHQILEGVVEAMKPYARHGLNVNVDFYAGVMYQLHGIPMDLYVPIFAIGRMPGWLVQCLEQQRSNILIRPLTLYNGSEQRDYVALEDRE